MKKNQKNIHTFVVSRAQRFSAFLLIMTIIIYRWILLANCKIYNYFLDLLVTTLLQASTFSSWSINDLCRSMCFFFFFLFRFFFLVCSFCELHLAIHRIRLLHANITLVFANDINYRHWNRQTDRQTTESDSKLSQKINWLLAPCLEINADKMWYKVKFFMLPEKLTKKKAVAAHKQLEIAFISIALCNAFILLIYQLKMINLWLFFVCAFSFPHVSHRHIQCNGIHFIRFVLISRAQNWKP